MNRYLLTSVVVLGMLTLGCARTPVTTVSSAPSPTGTASSSSSQSRGTASVRPAAHPSGTASGSQAGSSMSTTARPAPSEFTAVRELADIHFDFDKYEIRFEDATILDRNAQWLKANGKDLVLIEGHCDERGTAAYNVALGDRRAKAALDYLVAHGIAAQRITIVSYGEERPVCTEHTEACWAKNRRAHFLVKKG